MTYFKRRDRRDLTGDFDNWTHKYVKGQGITDGGVRVGIHRTGEQPGTRNGRIRDRCGRSGQGSETNGAEPDGDVPDGDVPDGDVPDGDVTDGDVVDPERTRMGLLRTWMWKT